MRNTHRIPELTMGPCRDFGAPGLEEIARLPVPAGMASHVKSIAAQFLKDGILPENDALYLAELADRMAVAPGYARFLGADKKREEALRLYGISRGLSSIAHPMRDDLQLAIGIILFNLSPSEKLVDVLSGMRPREGPLSYEYHSLMALNLLLMDRLDEAESFADDALSAIPGPDSRAYIRMLKGCIALRRGDPEAAIRYLDGCDANGRLRAMASFYSGIVRYEKSDFRGALKYFKSAMPPADDAPDALAVKCNIGACDVNIGRMSAGEREFQEVDRASRKKNGPGKQYFKLLAASYLGIISRASGDYPGAEAYYKEALKSCIKLNNTVGIANQVGNMGLLRRHSGDGHAALRLLNACLVYSERMGYWQGIRFSFGNIQATLVGLGKAPEARKFKEAYTARYPGLER